MKSNRVISLGIAVLFLLGTLSASTAAAVSLPAIEPWKVEDVVRFPGARVGTHVSIAHYPTSGNIYVSYYDAVNGDLKLSKQTTPGTGNCPGNNNWNCETIDSAGDVGQYSSIDIIRVPADGMIPAYTKIGISYYDATMGALKFAEFRTFPSTGIWSIQTIDDAVVTGQIRGTYTSMKYGYYRTPFIAYHAQGVLLSIYGSIKHADYVGGGTGNCGDGDNWFCETISSMDAQTDYGTHISVDMNYSGTMDVAFYDGFNSQLVYAYYQGFGGSCSNDAWDCIVVDGAGDVGKYVSISSAQKAGDPLKMAYFDGTTIGRVKYAVSVGSGGNCTSPSFECFDVDSIGYPSGHIGLSLAVDAQYKPVIAYMNAYEDLGPKNLYVARPASAYGLDYGNCGEVPPGDLFLYWQCKSVDNGNSYADEAEYAAVSVSPAGSAAVAYSEYDSYEDNYYLKVAHQLFTVVLPMVMK